MTLSEVKTQSKGIVLAVHGDASVHRRLADMGLISSAYYVRAKRKKSVLVEFCGEFSLVFTSSVAAQIEVNVENSALRQSERR